MIVAFEQLGSVLNGRFNTSVERDINGFEFILDFPDALITEYDSIKDILGGIKVTAYVVTKTASQVPICTQVGLDVLLEFTQNAEGFVRVRKYNSGALRQIEGYFQICPVGALTMQDDEQIVLTLEGLNTNAAFKLTIYGIELMTADHMVYSFDTQSVPTGQVDKQFDLSSAHTLIVPVTSGTLKDLQITYSNGKVNRHTEPELRSISLRSNDLAVAGDLTNYGYSDYYVINVENAIQAVVTTDGTGLTCWTVRDRAATKSFATVKMNSALVDTTDHNIQRETAMVNSK